MESVQFRSGTSGCCCFRFGIITSGRFSFGIVASGWFFGFDIVTSGCFFGIGLGTSGFFLGFSIVVQLPLASGLIGSHAVGQIIFLV